MDPLAILGRALLDEGYSFVTPTPSTHGRILERGSEARGLRDVFGWSKPFRPGFLPRRIEALLDAANAIRREGSLLRSTVRYSTLGPLLCVHSAYPTVEADAVFFGPDTYRFAALIDARVQRAGHVVDVGCGSGAGGLLLAPRALSVQLLDVNPQAVRFARANAELNGLPARAAESDVLSGAEGRIDLVVANPPYLVDPLERTYRDGGGNLGTALSVRIAAEALQRLSPGGRLLLYTATPVIDGTHVIRPALERLLRNARWDYRELDPDVFGEELERPEYAEVERIAVIALDATRL
jgi:release factor glutamine methyltransferase